MDVPERQDSPMPDRRTQLLGVLVLVVVLIVVLLGAGLGTFAPDDGGSPAIELTPEPTATPPPDLVETPGSNRTMTPTPDHTGTPTPTPTGTPTPGRNRTATPGVTPTPGGTGTPGETPTPTATDGTGGSNTGGGGSGGAGGGSGGDDDDGGSGGDGGGSDDSSVDLRTVGSTAVFAYDGVAPGVGRNDTLTVRNNGDVPGNLSIRDVSVQDSENGITGAEAAVDSTPGTGELSEHVHAVVQVEFEDGRTAFLYGTGDGARSLAALAAEPSPSVAGRLDPGADASVRIDWWVPGATGNEIQSDGATVDFEFGLRET